MKSFIFARRDPIQEAKDELQEAELALLKSQSAMEYAASDVTYQMARVKRLKHYLGHDVVTPIRTGSGPLDTIKGR